MKLSKKNQFKELSQIKQIAVKRIKTIFARWRIDGGWNWKITLVL
jgi:hypothetical protein